MFRKDYRAILAGGMAAAAAVTALHLSSQDTTNLDSGAAVNAVALPGTMRDLGLSPQLLSGAVKPASAKNASYSVTTDFMRTALVSPKAAALSRTMLGGNISGKLMSSDGSHVVAECTSSISGKIGRLNPFSTVGSTTCTATTGSFEGRSLDTKQAIAQTTGSRPVRQVFPGMGVGQGGIQIARGPAR